MRMGVVGARVAARAGVGGWRRRPRRLSAGTAMIRASGIHLDAAVGGVAGDGDFAPPGEREIAPWQIDKFCECITDICNHSEVGLPSRRAASRSTASPHEAAARSLPTAAPRDGTHHFFRAASRTPQCSRYPRRRAVGGARGGGGGAGAILHRDPSPRVLSSYSLNLA